MTSPRYLETKHGTRIAWHRTTGRSPGVVFLGGFMSDMEGSKAMVLEAWCRREGRAFVRFDYQGHGQSSGEFADGTIGLWTADALAVIDGLTSGPQILVGSSMGGWVSMLVARARPGRIAGLVGIAAAPDFTVRHWEELSASDQQTITETGRLEVFSEYGPDPYIFTKALFDDGWQNRVLNAPYRADFPMRLIQGTADPDVPWQTAMQIADVCENGDVEVILVPGGDHRLSQPADLDRLVRVVGELAG